MKKIIGATVGVVLFLAAMYVGAWYLMDEHVSAPVTENAVVKLGKTAQCTAEDVQGAADCVITYFQKHYRGCELLTLTYDEAKEEGTAEDRIRYARSLSEGKNVQDVIVLYTNFYVKEDYGGFSGNTEHTNWSWVVVRDSDAEAWRILTAGY